MINSNPSKAKKNQKLLKIFLVVGVILLAFGFTVFTDDNTPRPVKQENKIKRNSLVNEADMIKTKWMGDVATDLDINKKSLKDTEKENKELKKELSEIKLMITNLDQNTAPTHSFVNRTNGQPKDMKTLIQGNQAQTSANSGFFNKFPVPYTDGPRIKPVEKRTVVYNQMDNTLNLVQITKPSDSKTDITDTKQKKNPLDILPTGSITKVMLLSGFDAPTMAQAKSNPLPILMKVIDMSILPNKDKYDLRECFIMGEGYGDLSSERVYIRTNNISCDTQSGKHIDMPFKAMVTGEDGKSGLRGTVVTKQGSLIARTLIAGFLQGVSEAFTKSQQYTITGASGLQSGINQMSSTDTLKYGMYGGASKATEKLADFYLKMADQVSPVIEISARRKVDLITTSKAQFKILEEDENDNK